MNLCVHNINSYEISNRTKIPKLELCQYLLKLNFVPSFLSHSKIPCTFLISNNENNYHSSLSDKHVPEKEEKLMYSKTVYTI